MAACATSPTLDADDAAIYAVVLHDLSSRPDSMLLDKGVLLVKPESTIVDTEFARPPYEVNDTQCRPSAMLHAASTTRNARKVKIAKSISASSRWRVATAKEMETPLYMQHETARSIVRLKRPGISADRREALMVLSFLWSEHAADAVYLLRHDESGWRITCSDLFFHL
ncbi:MAG TPA: hypothetical protein VN581_07095 [Patescibacteria group bacterium]|nr:hypothetical protein [Patescibacteria group bacterium]